MAAILAHPSVKPLLSDEHFSVDGTLIKAWASMKSFQPKEDTTPPRDDDPGGPPPSSTVSAGPPPLGWCVDYSTKFQGMSSSMSRCMC
jgi:hypothetical protein